ncbi:MAG: hypothetical protein E7404_03890 [Ruminococcaceae bacterium]|nr:hypothetical protein [Oscillospiraceae bacterium]
MSNNDYLRNEPFFWSRLGFGYDPPRYDKNNNQIIFSRNYEKYRKTHKDFEDINIKYHTTILNSGWVDDNTYDYRLTDETLDEIFKDNPNIFYMPRVKLNAPPGWCKNHPEDVFVYEKYQNLSLKEISDICTTLEQDYFGFDCPNGYSVNGGDGSFVDDRPNVGGKIALQSFSSPQWILDASKALSNLIDHINNSPYKDRIIGYHIAYGQCGETCLWGGWRPQSQNLRGDFGYTNTKEFIKYGLKKYKTEENLLKKWNYNSMDEIKVPSLKLRDAKKDCLRDVFYDESNNLICLDYNEFMSEANAFACEEFCRVVKEKSDNKLAAGIFYAYMYMLQSAYMGHLAIDKVMDSPYIDFVASPKAYFRTLAGEPGGEQGPSYSINKKKVWLDEIDNWTHLDRREGKAENLFETRTLILREGVKNLSYNQGFWWMDLGEGWYDMPEIMGYIKEMYDAQNIIYKKEHKSISEILIVVDEKSLKSMSVSYGLCGGLLYNLQSEIKLCGAPVDTLRLSDLYNTDISQYKLIVFANAFSIDEKLREILKKNAKGKTYIWNYAAGVLSPEFSYDNVFDVTGFNINEFKHLFVGEEFGYKIEKYNFGPVKRIDIDFPLFEILPKENITPVSYYPDKKIMCAMTKKDGGVSYLCAYPSMMASDFRKIAQDAGCKMYAPLNTTVYADNRIIGVFPKDDVCFKLDFGKFTSNGLNSVNVDIKAKGAEYFVFD